MASAATLSAQDVWGPTAGTVDKSQRLLLLKADRCAGTDRATGAAACDSFPWIGRGPADAAVLYNRGARGWATADLRRGGTTQHLREQVIIFDQASGFPAFFDQHYKTCDAAVLATANGRPATLLTRSNEKATIIAIDTDRLVAVETSDSKASEGDLSTLLATAEAKAADLHL